MEVKIKDGFSQLTDNNLSAETETILNQMTANAVDYPVPSPPLATIATAKGVFDADKAFKGGPAQTALKNQSRADLIALLKLEALYVQKTCGNDLAKALRSGYKTRAPRHPVGVLPPPLNFQLKAGKNTGWIEASMKSYGSKAHSYVYRYSQDGSTDPETWSIVTSTSANKTIMRLIALKLVFVQGAGVGTSTTLVWSSTRSIGVL